MVGKHGYRRNFEGENAITESARCGFLMHGDMGKHPGEIFDLSWR